MSQTDTTLIVREIGAGAFDRAWSIFRVVVAAGDTYSYSPSIDEAEARVLWTTAPTRCFLAEIGGEPVGCYMLRPNQPGLGDHVANAGYMVAPDARGRGVAAAMCEHSMQVARAAGFSAMQFNYVVASNEGAVRLWQRLGFAIVGRVPDAFRHATHGLTDILVMHRFL